MKKNLTRLLSILLALVLTVGMLPVSALADGWQLSGSLERGESASMAESIGTQAATTDSFYKILHLDCGRKYFSMDWIIALLYEMQDAGYNQLQLAFGNDGLRFLLDDMSFTANGTAYSHDTVVSKVEAGNKAQNSSGDARWLTETEMDTIIAKAGELGIEIVPLLNLPGHANAILDIANDQYNASGSNNTLDVVATSDNARNFGMAILKKYVDYFAAKGCKFFNFGADEYANDASGTFSFSRLTTTEYGRFASFLNDMAGYIIEKGMTPRAFNDGLYYNRNDGNWDMNTSVNTNIKRIQCCYWSSGWDSYPVAYASTIHAKGHDMINTNGDFYYVLGKNDQFDSGYSYAANFSNSKFMSSTIDNPVGSMFCIWCDYPNAETETEVAKKTRLVLRAMAARMNDQSISTISTSVVENGFNEDGTLNTSRGEPVTPELKITSPDGVTTLPLTGVLELSLSDKSLSATWTASPEGIVSLTGNSNDGTDSVTGSSVIVQPRKAGTVTITATVTTGDGSRQTATFELTVTDPSALQQETVDLKVGDTDTRTQDGENNANNVDRADLDEAIATVEVIGTDASQTSKTVYTQATTSYGLLAGNHRSSWGKNSFFHEVNGTYYPVYSLYSADNGYSTRYYYGYSVTDSIYDVTSLGSSRYYSDLITTLYKQSTDTTDVPASTAITFTGVAPGTTYVTVGKTRYPINVSYKEETITLTPNQSKTVAYDGTLNTNGLNKDVATVAVTGSGTNQKVTVTGVALGETSFIVGGTKYTVIVAEEDLDAVTPLTVEYWITNGRVYNATGDNEVSVPAATAGIASEAGMDVASFVLENGYKEDPTSGNNVGKTLRTVDYWRCRLLDKTLTNSSTSEKEEQTTDPGDDETMSGVSFTKIRYYAGSWAVYTAENEWVNVESKHQLVAYYLEHVEVTDEVDSHAADWGKIGDGSTSGDYLDTTAVNTLSFQVVYEDGTTNPSGTDAANLKSKTLCYGYWKDGRGIGTVILDESSDFEIYKVTAQTGSMTGSGETWGSYTVTSFTWDTNETGDGDNAVTVWEGTADNGQVILHNSSTTPSKDGIYKNLMWDENYEAILLRIYVRAKVTEDSLRVHYIDQKDSQEFYNYNIAVKSGTYFDQTFGLDSNGSLTGNTVQNIKGLTQTVTTDLSVLTEIGAQYRYSAYKCVKAERSVDGKDVYLYYTFDNTVTYVVDFGLPVTIKPQDINDSLIGKNVTLDKDVSVDGVTSGSVTINNHEFTYTPGSDFLTSNGESLTVTYHGSIPTADGTQTGSVSYQVYIVPASNVLYEENFLTTDSTDWTQGTKSSAPTAAQETQKFDAADPKTYNVFGTDDAYKAKVGEAGVWQASDLIDTATNKIKMTGKLTTTFYGNAFDLIGNCGPTTGRVFMVIRPTDPNEKRGYIIDVDTRYSKGNLYQVPLAHVVLDKEMEYKVEIMALGLAATSAATQTNSSAFAVMSAQSVSGDEMLRSVVESYGLSMADVQYVSMESTLSAASASASVSGTSNAATFAAAPQAAAAIEHEAGTHVEIDSFRVYRSSDSSKANSIAQSYPTAEQNITYRNILDVVKGEFGAYTESATGTYTVSNYEAAGGPQNEIYLSNGQFVSFKIAELAGKSIQVSLRAVEGTAAGWSTSTNGTATELKTNTEMYYTVTAGNDGLFTIANTGNALLAIGNVKLPSGVTTDNVTSASEIDEEVLLQSLRAAFGVSEVEPEPDVFEPDTFDAKVSTLRMLRSKLVTIRISVSSDVSYVTVNGVKYWPSRAFSWQRSRTIQVRDTIGRNESKTYTIVAYDANGAASAPITVNG